MDSKRDTIIRNVAFQLFLEKGYEATSIREISKLSSIEAPTIYYYFGSKRGLFLAVCNWLWEKYEEQLNANEILEQKLSPAARLFRLFQFNIQYAVVNPMENKFIIRYALFPPAELSAEVNEYLEMTNQRKAVLVEKVIAEWFEQRQIQGKSVDEILKIYNTFTANNTFNVVFYGLQPNEEEILKMWQLFLECRIKY